MASGDCWLWGTPSIGPESGHDSDRCWGVTLSENYGVNWVGTLGSLEFLVCDESPRLSFFCWYRLDAYDDYVRVMVVDQAGERHELAAITATFESWKELSYPLDYFKGQRIRGEFRFTSDSYGTYPGFFVDDVHIGCD